MKTKYAIIVGLLIIIGCSSGSPVTMPQEDMTPSEFMADTNTGLLGLYELIIDVDTMTADLVPNRDCTLGESWIVSGKSYFSTLPCKDCFRIAGLGYESGRLIVVFNIRHPFEKGDTGSDPSARNRRDLDIFDLALLVMPKPVETKHFPLMGINIPQYVIDNASGYTSELANLISLNVAIPYFLVIDDDSESPPVSSYNRFEMGSNEDFSVKFPIIPGQTLVFDLYLTFGYGFSATAPNRLNPTYYNPEFNRKAAWKVKATPPNAPNPPAIGNTWDDLDNSTEYDVIVHVYDWQIGANVNPSLTNPSDVYASSNVAWVGVEIPGMTNELKTVSGDSHMPGGDGMPGNPLIYRVPIANENLIPMGTYTGLVAVYDERQPLAVTAGRDHLIHTPNGIDLNNYQIPSFRTYQTFPATVVAGEIPVSGDLIWAKSAGGAGFDFGCGAGSHADNSIVVTGWFTQSATFGEIDDPNRTILTSAGSNDIFIARYNPDGTLRWARRAGGVGNNRGLAIKALPDNSFIATGTYQQHCIFGPGEDRETELLPYGDDDIFIARFNANGTLNWVKRAGGWYRDRCEAVTALSDNRIVITGDFMSFITLGEGEANETTLYSSGVNDTFIAAFNPNGLLAWAKRVTGTFNIDGLAITALSDDSVVITGAFGGQATFGEGEATETQLAAQGARDVFIARYNSSGELLWAKRAGGAYSDWSYGISALSDNTFVVTGHYGEEATFGLGEPNETTLSSPGYEDIFIARYNADGTLRWAKKAGGTSTFTDQGDAVTVRSDDSFVVVGRFGGIAVFGQGEANETSVMSAGGWDIFVAAYNPNGTLQWAKSAGGASADYARGLTVLSDDSVVVAGDFMNSAVFGKDEPNETHLNSAGGRDIYFARFSK